MGHGRTIGRLAGPLLAGILIAATLTSLGGCRWPVRARSMELVAEGHVPARLRADYSEAYFFEGPTHTSIYLSEIPFAELAKGATASPPLTGQVLHIEILWIPKAGRTPLESTATNATIRQIVLVENEIGIYGGAGFVWPHSAPGSRNARMTVRDASMALLESSDGFVDRFTPANLRGTFTARRSETQTLRLRQAISQIVTDAFQESRFVDLGEIDEAEVLALLSGAVGNR